MRLSLSQLGFSKAFLKLKELISKDKIIIEKESIGFVLHHSVQNIRTIGILTTFFLGTLTT